MYLSRSKAQFSYVNALPHYHLGDPGVDGRKNIKMHLLEMRCGGRDCIELVLDRDRWRALVTVVMNLPVP